MKTKWFAVTVFLSISIVYPFRSYASQNQLINGDHEKNEIAALEDDIIQRVNEGGASADLSRDITSEDLDFDRAYRVYDDPGIFFGKD